MQNDAGADCRENIALDRQLGRILSLVLKKRYSRFRKACF
jgi:hypothetical protein